MARVEEWAEDWSMAVNDAAFTDVATLCRYVEARRAAARATVLAAEPDSRETWIEVVDAMRQADQKLARCDPVWRGLRVAYLDMIAGNGTARRQRSENWGASVQAMCRFDGPDSEHATRLRALMSVVCLDPGSSLLRRRRAAERRYHRVLGVDRLHSQRVGATWRLADLYAASHDREAVERILATLLEDFRDQPGLPPLARRALEYTDRVGAVATGRTLCEVVCASNDRLAGADPDPELAVYGQGDRARLGEYLLLTGEARRAETMLRDTLGELEGSGDRMEKRSARSRHKRILGDCLAGLADCLMARGKADQVGELYRRAHRCLADVCLDSDADYATLRSRFNSAVYLAGEWKSFA